MRNMQKFYRLKGYRLKLHINEDIYEEIFYDFNGTRVFSKLDLKWSFDQIYPEGIVRI